MNSDVMTIVQHLSRHLRSHPDACDTSEGIARWWVGAEQQPVPPSLADAALEWMTACGVVEAVRAADGRVRWRRRPAKEVSARLDVMAVDPRRVVPAERPGRWYWRIH